MPPGRLVGAPPLLRSRSVEPLVLLLAGAGALVGGFLTLRSFGPGYRIGRLLATTRSVSVADAIAIARADEPEYVGVEGRIDSDDDFLDENGRPLVFRRARLEVRRGPGWRPLDEHRQAVPFVVRQGLDEIAVAIDEIREGVVVVPRESSGTAGEIPDRVGPDIAASTAVRYRVELVSSVDHATVLGVPRIEPDGRPVIGAGSRKPVIVSTLPRDEAMRVLAGGRRGRTVAAVMLLGTGVVLFLGGGTWAMVRALG